jgi:hypothetical protein
MCVIYVAEEHDQILSLWRAQRASSLRVLHLDFHCDMRGLLIDRKAQRAYRIWDINPAVDQGNFLTCAILEGLVSGIRWVHGEPGGRRYDVGTVKYESDLTALPHCWLLTLRGKLGVPIHYEVMPYTDWTGLIEGEHLDIDWDFFACMAYPADTIQDRVEAFLGREFRTVPEQVYVCYSPDFSHPSRVQFQNFVGDLAQIFKAEVVELQSSPDMPATQPFYKKYVPPALFRLARRVYYSTSLGLRKLGIY